MLLRPIVEAALEVKGLLDRIGLTGYPKTTGGDGMHVYVPVEPVYTFEETRTFAELMARLVAPGTPGLFTMPRTVAKRRKTACISIICKTKIEDHRRAVCVAGIPGSSGSDAAGVGRSAAGPRSGAIQHPQCARRFAEKGDLFGGVLTKPQRLEDGLARLEKLFH